MNYGSKMEEHGIDPTALCTYGGLFQATRSRPRTPPKVYTVQHPFGKVLPERSRVLPEPVSYKVSSIPICPRDLNLNRNGVSDGSMKE